MNHHNPQQMMGGDDQQQQRHQQQQHQHQSQQLPLTVTRASSMTDRRRHEDGSRLGAVVGDAPPSCAAGNVNASAPSLPLSSSEEEEPNSPQQQGTAATAVVVVVQDPFLSQPQPQPQPQPQLPSRSGNTTTNSIIKQQNPRRLATTAATAAAATAVSTTSFHSYLQQATAPSNFFFRATVEISGVELGGDGSATDNTAAAAASGVVDHHIIDYASFKSLLRNFRRRRRKIRRALLLRGQQQHQNQQQQNHSAGGRQQHQAVTCLPIAEFEQLVLLLHDNKTNFPPRHEGGNHHETTRPGEGDVELGPIRRRSTARSNQSRRGASVAGDVVIPIDADLGGPATPYVTMSDDDVGLLGVGDVNVIVNDDDDADDGGVLDISNDAYFDMSDNGSRLRGQHHHQQQPQQVPPSVIYTPTPQAGNLTTIFTTTTTTTSAKPQRQKFNFNTLSRGMKRRRAVGNRNPSPFSAASLSSPFENRRNNLQKMISRREMTRRLANFERQEIVDFLDHELEHKVFPGYMQQYERLTTEFIGLQQHDFEQDFELQHRQDLVVLGKELLDMYAYCTITVVVLTQILQKYDVFARAYDGIPMMQYYMKNITREGNKTKDSKSMASFFYRKILHHADVEAMCETYKNILISSISTTSSSEGRLDRSRLDTHLNVFETEHFFIHEMVSAARDVATSSSSAEPPLQLSANLPSSSPISLGYVPPTTPIGTSRPVRMPSPTFRLKIDTTSTYERAITGIDTSWMKLQQYFLLGYGGEDRMIGYHSSLPSTRLSSSSGGIVTMTGLMSHLARWRVESEELWSEILVMTTDPENLAAVTHQGGKFTTVADSLNSLTCFSNPFEMIDDENNDDDCIVRATSTKTSDKDNDPKRSHPTSEKGGQFTKQELFNLGLCLSAAGLYCLNYYIVEPSSTMYVNALGADDAVSALLIGMMPIASFGAAIAYSVWTNKAFRTPFIASCTLMLVGNVVYSSAFNFRSLPMALIGRFMTGLGGPKCIIRRYMADTTTMQQRTSVNALFGMVVAAGSALGPGCAILLNRLDFVIKVPLMFRGLLRRDGGPGDEDVGNVSLFVNGMTGPGWFMAGLWTLFATCFFAMFREIPRVGLQQQLQKERQQVIANVSCTSTEDLKTNEEPLQQSTQTINNTANCSDVNLVVNDSRSMVGNCNSFHNPNGGEGYIDDLATLMSGKTNTTSSSSMDNQSLITMSINGETFDDEFDSDDDFDGNYHGYALQNQFDERDRYFDRRKLVKACSVMTKPTRRCFRFLTRLWNEFSRACSRITLSVQLCLGLLFAKVFVIETLVSCTSALSKNRYGWTIKQVGMLGCVNGLSVIPLSVFVGRLSMTLHDRLLMICLLCVGVSGLCLLIDVSDIRMAFGVPKENPDVVDGGRYNSGSVIAVGPLQYVIGYFLTYVSIQSFEGVIGSTLSKVIPTKLATGTFNSGLLATLVDTSGRFSGDIFISIMAMINIRQLMNLLFVPGLLILLTCLIVVRRYYDLLAV